MTKNSKWLLPVLILFYTAYNSMELLNAWVKAPLDWFGWAPFLVWLPPLIFIGRRKAQPLFLWMAVIFSLSGNLVSLNALRYLGFSSAIAAWAPFSWGTWVWWACSVSWMPAFGWLGSRLFPEHVLIVRFLFVGVAAACVIMANRGRLPK